SATLTKERMVGLTLEEQQALESLLLKEQYVKEILNKLKEGDLQIASEQLAYIQQYEKYVELKPIPYLNISHLKIEERKAQTLLEQHLPYSEERTPFHTALFTKQLFQILFSPFTAFFFVLIFCYIYTFDRGNRAFDFLKINSLSNGAIYYGYMLTFVLMVLLYIVLVCCLAMLPPLLMGNSATLFYPLEVAVHTEIVWVPVWKWLVFIPIG
ncbi:hypothetical protein, partial [Metasolibacillus meyeri]|uniref:hypothetical protein n=1 Tax=Metasolibacillus meyeri TaxID=1071052 RepID=UPI00187D47D4